MGIEVRSQAQDIFTVVGTREQLRQLVEQPACRRLRSPRLLFRTVEDASAQAEINLVHMTRKTSIVNNCNCFRLIGYFLFYTLRINSQVFF